MIHSGHRIRVTNPSGLWRLVSSAAALLALGGPLGAQSGLPASVPPNFPAKPNAPRYQFQIEARTPVKDLLPAAPYAIQVALPWLVTELDQVPKVLFQDPLVAQPEKAEEQIAHLVAKINHVNGGSDEFIRLLREHRPDLAGLPFVMGDVCRQSKDRARAFFLEALVTRAAMHNKSSAGVKEQPFWTRYDGMQNAVAQETNHNVATRELPPARIAALMQILGPEAAELRQGLVQRLAAMDGTDATRALARLAIFSPDAEVRTPALGALRRRPRADYIEMLKDGLHYPWPEIAGNAGKAIAKLGGTDLVPWLVAQLDEPDPRAPVAATFNGQPALVVRELVRINHHRSCLLCHAPGNTVDIQQTPGNGSAVQDVVTAPVPVPGQPLAPPSAGYNQSNAPPDILVRVDVTYLRQDFSLLQQVDLAAPWPAKQRFDFLVRTRAVTAEEAMAYERWVHRQGPGYLAPHRRAAVAALRLLTGRDAAEPTAKAWQAALVQ